jgi:enoyl-CoA hydratase/carnithine racemase
MPFETLLVEDRGPVRVLTMNRPERLNALSRNLVAEIGLAARAASADRAVRAVVLTGAGEKAFCAGADLKERQTMTLDEVRDFLALYRASFGDLDRCSKPVVAAIGGVAFGGGLEVALACDLRVADPAAKMGLTETRLGIMPGAGGTQRLPRLVGVARAKDLILTGRHVGATEAFGFGLVNRISEPGKVIGAAVALAEECAEGAPISLERALAAIDLGTDTTFESGLDIERECYAATLVTKDRDEGIAAFREKRKPVFRGE